MNIITRKKEKSNIYVRCEVLMEVIMVLSSTMKHHAVWWKFTEVSKEHTAPLFRFKASNRQDGNFFLSFFALKPLYFTGQLSQYNDRLQTGGLGFDFWYDQEIFLFSTVFRLALGPTQLPIQWISGALSLLVKWPGREADPSPQSRVKIKNDGAEPPLPHTSSWHGT
jgi:hypothetical protein